MRCSSTGHTVADLIDQVWKAARAAVGARKRFVEDLRAITTYLVFPTWASLVETLRAGSLCPASLTRNRRNRKNRKGRQSAPFSGQGALTLRR